MSPPQLSPSDALIVVDVQNDFCPGGALSVAEGGQVVPVLNRWIEAARTGGATIVASRDWHPPRHISFRDRGGPWPAHCLQNSSGAQIHPGLKLPDGMLIVSKGSQPDLDSYSAFDGTGLGNVLRSRDIRRLWIGGLAQDVCVRATVLDGLKEGFEVHLIKSATRAVNVKLGDGDHALQEMLVAGCFAENGGNNE